MLNTEGEMLKLNLCINILHKRKVIERHPSGRLIELEINKHCWCLFTCFIIKNTRTQTFIDIETYKILQNA